MKMTTQCLALVCALTLSSTINATGTEGGKRPHRKHSKSPDKHKPKKEKSHQNTALQTAKQVMDDAKKQLEDALVNLREAQNNLDRAEQRRTQLSTENNHFNNALETIINQRNENGAEQTLNALHALRQEAHESFNNTMAVINNIERAQTAVNELQTAVDIAQANYDVARDHYEQLLAQAK